VTTIDVGLVQEFDFLRPVADFWAEAAEAEARRYRLRAWAHPGRITLGLAVSIGFADIVALVVLGS
jgi:hypothetical protein